jgi:hypothetical protein
VKKSKVTGLPKICMDRVSMVVDPSSIIGQLFILFLLFFFPSPSVDLIFGTLPVMKYELVSTGELKHIMNPRIL